VIFYRETGFSYLKFDDIGHSSDKLIFDMVTQPPDFKTKAGSHILNQKLNEELYLKPPLSTGLLIMMNQTETFAVTCRSNRTSGYTCFHSRFIYLVSNKGTDKSDLLIATY